MPSISWLISKITQEHPTITFQTGEEFYWSPTASIITYREDGEPALLLHEVAHALLKHRHYKRDITLIEMERDAWNYARDFLATPYGVNIEESTIDENLDTYRDWLHNRSSCPRCRSIGVQVDAYRYRCLACQVTWQVNRAHLCRLRRQII